MQLIGRYHNAGFESVADGVMDFFDRRQDLQRPGIAFGGGGNDQASPLVAVATAQSPPKSQQILAC